MRNQHPTSSDVPDPEVEAALREIEELSGATYAAPDLDCDLIMKGGITSGVVYPLTICRLATTYRLRSIGGTSAGAIAAGAAAAAEHRRQTDPADPSAGYRRLARLPQDISTRLDGLFQARPETRRLYAVLGAAIDPDTAGAGRVAAVLGRIVAGQPGWFAAGFLATLALVAPGLVVANGFPMNLTGVWRVLLGLLLPALLALCVALVAAAVGFVREAGRVLPPIGYGLTDGATHDATPALTDWLADELDATAGVEPGRCLTLGDLWGEKALAAWKKGSDSDWVKAGPMWRARAPRRISLEVMTTDLTLRRPFRMPFTTQEFMFAKSDWERLFPDRVVETMARDEFLTAHRHPETGELLYRFPGRGSAENPTRPGPEHLPVVVMVRMSLSFPGLITAVPLYAVDYAGDHSVVRHWFSDGGVSSNFPMHLFDALLPSRPTFGVNLSAPDPLYPDAMVWRPGPTSGGTNPRALPFDGVGGFIAALKDTMVEWADNKQVTQRGYADRVVEIRLRDGEGGMNLRMPEDLVLKLAGRGALAGRELLTFDWEAHRVVRYRTAMARLNDLLDRTRAVWTSHDGRLYPEHLAAYPATGSPGSSYLGGAEWRAEDRAAADALFAAVGDWETAGWPAINEAWPQPAPEIRTVPE